MRIENVRTVCATCVVAVFSVIAAASPVLKEFVRSLQRGAASTLI